MSVKKFLIVLPFSFSILCGCSTTSSSKKAFQIDESQLAIRSIQTKEYAISNKKEMMQVIVNAMQDLDFVINKADLILGTISGSKYFKNIAIDMTVSARKKGEKIIVRANAQRGVKTIENPNMYQDFFQVLDKAYFLAKNNVD